MDQQVAVFPPPAVDDYGRMAPSRPCPLSTMRRSECSEESYVDHRCFASPSVTHRKWCRKTAPGHHGQDQERSSAEVLNDMVEAQV